GWSLGYITLMVLALFMAIMPLWKLWHLRRSRTPEWTAEERQASIIYSARLALLCSAGLTLVLFALSPLAAEKPWSTRYLIGLLSATPAVLWPLWKGITMVKLANKARLSRALFASFTIVIILLIGTTFLLGTIHNLSEFPCDERLVLRDSNITRDLMRIVARL